MESRKEELQKKRKLEIILYNYLVATRGGKIECVF